MNRMIMMTVAALALVTALTGCCMFGGEKNCCKCGKAQPGHGANASMSMGIGTSGVSGDVGASMH